MIVQIYTTQTPQEGLDLAECGVDQIGVTPAKRGLPGEISLELAASIFATIGDRAVKVALSVEEDINQIVDMVTVVKPDILHLCGDINKVTPAQVAKIRLLLPDMPIMQAIPVTSQAALQIARDFEPVSDYFILDSYSDQIGGIGAAGFTHDWSVSRAIVQQSSIPVILAGGLTADNVAEAIQAVKPWGVDSLTHTNLPLAGGGFKKDIEKVRRFVTNAKAAG
jgi:phosphoribosylanthranilate isomerase